MFARDAFADTVKPSREVIAKAIRSAHSARVRGDAETYLSFFSDDAVVQCNARGAKAPGLEPRAEGRDAARRAFDDLTSLFRFEDWEEVELLVDGHNAAIRWRAKVTCLGNGRSRYFDGVDLAEFRDGKLTRFYQSTDTAGFLALMA